MSRGVKILIGIVAGLLLVGLIGVVVCTLLSAPVRSSGAVLFHESRIPHSGDDAWAAICYDGAVTEAGGGNEGTCRWDQAEVEAFIASIHQRTHGKDTFNA